MPKSKKTPAEVANERREIDAMVISDLEIFKLKKKYAWRFSNHERAQLAGKRAVQQVEAVRRIHLYAAFGKQISAENLIVKLQETINLVNEATNNDLTKIVQFNYHEYGDSLLSIFGQESDQAFFQRLQEAEALDARNLAAAIQSAKKSKYLAIKREAKIIEEFQRVQGGNPA